jgi:hypothetical protein
LFSFHLLYLVLFPFALFLLFCVYSYSYFTDLLNLCTWIFRCSLRVMKLNFITACSKILLES